MTAQTDTADPLTEALAQLGYRLGAVDPGLPATLGGPLVNLVGTDGGDPVALVAVLDRPESNVDAILQSIAGALRRAHPELTLRPGQPVADLNELTAPVGAPTEMLPILENEAVIGSLVMVIDRRTGRPEAVADGNTGSVAGAVAASIGGAGHLSRLRDVQLEVTVELGRTAMIVSDVLALEIGSVIELDRAAGAPIDVRINGTLLARGEVVVVDDEYAIRLTEMIDPDRG